MSIDESVPASWLIANAELFDGTGSARRKADVLIEGDRIARVADRIEHYDCPQASLIDGRGLTLMPGMVDGHTHLGNGGTVHHSASGQETVEEKVLLSAHVAQTMLDHGFTSAYLGGDRNPATNIALRKAISEGWMAGPRMRVASWESTTLSLLDPHHMLHIDRPSVAPALRRWVHEMADLGVDIVKIPLSGESGLKDLTSREETYNDEEVAAAAEAARERGVRLSAHSHSAEGIQMAIRHGFRAIYHVSYADDDAIAALAAAKGQVFVAPTPGVLYALLHDMKTPPTKGMETVDMIESLKTVVPKMYAAGVCVVPGGDYGFTYNPTGKNARDLQLFCDWFGLTPSQALRCATESAGQVMDMAGELGLVSDGYLADLLLVDGDPTSDITIMQDPNRLLMIMQGGHPYKLSTSLLADAPVAAYSAATPV